MIINKPENQDVEFKQSWQDEYLKWICAFANTKGGTLYIGVNDKGNVLGLPDYHHLSEAIPLKIRQTMGLMVDVQVLTAEDDETLKYLKIAVEHYPFPVSYHGKYYKRIGSTTQEVIGIELDKMILSVQGRTWDSVPVPHVKVSDLDALAFQIFKKRALFTHRLTEEELNVSNEELIRNLRGFENEYLTRATVLSFHPDPEKWFTGAYVKIAYFLNNADILYQDEVHGSLMVQVERTMEIIYTKYMKALIDYDGIARRETYFFPHDAFRELLLNALIHRDYMTPTPIQIQIFNDRIDIWNIGEMPKSISIKDLFTVHRSEPRNPNVANIFFRCGYVESWGRGYFKIQTLCEQVNAKIPEPRPLSGGLSVVCNACDLYLELAKKYGVDGTNTMSNNASNEGLNDQKQNLLDILTKKMSNKMSNKEIERMKLVLDYLIENKTISKTKAMEIIDVEPKTAQRLLVKAEEVGLLSSEGKNKGKFYTINISNEN